ncbi:MAG: DUF6456 domain-containing protein [Xanthobacteraceae bacterium]|nr:DUF6456 domain-containing protein [Xanthobacteraceae bacterium]
MTAAGQARRRKRNPRRDAAAVATADVGAFRARHLDLAARDIVTDTGLTRVLMNDSESPLAWLARRKGRDGRAMIEPMQFVAGERLRADFTRAQLTPRVTSNWSAPAGRGSRGSGASEMTDLVVASRQRVRLALEARGPEFAGVLLDVCCFLRGLEDLEHERGWPSRSAKVVLQLALSRLARHYGLERDGVAGHGARLRTWLADDVAFGGD